MILVTCPACAGVMHVPLQYAGQRGPCQSCGQAVQVPHAHDNATDSVTDNLTVPSAKPYAQRKVVVPRLGNWFTSVGWFAVLASSPLAGLQYGGHQPAGFPIWYGLLPMLVIFTLMGVYDLHLQHLSKQELVKWGIAFLVFWPFAYPAYLLKRHDFEGRPHVMLTVLFGGMWILGIIFIDSWAEWNTWVRSGGAL